MTDCIRIVSPQLVNGTGRLLVPWRVVNTAAPPSSIWTPAGSGTIG